jgi:hypothetical protein
MRLGRWLALGGCALGCAREGVDLGGDTLARNIQRGTGCAESTVVTGNVIVSQQEDLEALAGCEEIRGNLIVRAFAGADLTPLAALRRVTGQFGLGVAQRWTEIVGFTISGLFDPEIELIRSGWVQSLDGVQALEQVGLLYLRGLPDEDLTAFESLATVSDDSSGAFSGTVILQQNMHLRSLSGLDDVTGVQGLVVTLSPELVSLNGIGTSGLETISLYTSPALADLSALAATTTLDNLILNDLGIVDLNAFANLESVDNLSIFGNRALVDASGFGSLQSANLINVADNPLLKNLPSFTSFEVQPSTIRIRGNAELESIVLDLSNTRPLRYDIVGFPEQANGEYVGYELGIDVIDVRENAKLQSFAIPAGLTKAHLVLVSANPSLTSTDFGSLKELGQLSIDANPSLTHVDTGDLARVSLLQVTNNPLFSPVIFDGVESFVREISGNAE